MFGSVLAIVLGTSNQSHVSYKCSNEYRLKFKWCRELTVNLFHAICFHLLKTLADVCMGYRKRPVSWKETAIADDCLNVFDHFVELALKWDYVFHWFRNNPKRPSFYQQYQYLNKNHLCWRQQVKWIQKDLWSHLTL